MIYEYKVYQFVENTLEDTEAALNRYGAAGWELVTITATGAAIYKRPADSGHQAVEDLIHTRPLV